MYEMFDLGSRPAGSRPMTSYPACRTSTVSTKSRCFFQHQLFESTMNDYLNECEYVELFLKHLIEHPHKLSRNFIFYSFDEQCGDGRISSAVIVEKHGLAAINDFLERYSKRLFFPWRQNETIDSYFVSDENGCIFISNKTATIRNRKYSEKNHGFDLSAARHCNLCHWVLAIYTESCGGEEAFDRVAVIPAWSVYNDGGLQRYCWNDDKVAYCDAKFNSDSVTPGVVLFSMKNDGKKLLAYLSNPPPLPSRSEPAQVIPEAKRAKNTLDILAEPSTVPATEETTLVPCLCNDPPSRSSTDYVESAVIDNTEVPSSQHTPYTGSTESDY